MDNLSAQIPDLERMLADLQQNAFPPHIAELPVKDKIKRAFTLYEHCAVTQPWGLFPAIPKEIMVALKGMAFRKRSAFNKVLLTQIWWGFFFGPFYYFAARMWRKGVVILFGLLFLSIVIDVLFTFASGMEEMPKPLSTGIGCGFGYMMSMMATYDVYRLKIKKQTFWW